MADASPSHVAFFGSERRTLRTVPETSPTTCVPMGERAAAVSSTGSTPSTTPSSSSSSSRSGPKQRPTRGASFAILAPAPSQDLPARITTDPLLLKPAMQSCLKNPFRLSLPHSPSDLSGWSAQASLATYPSPSIIFPSDADKRALAFAKRLAEEHERPVGVTSSQNAVHQHYDRTRERAAIVELEDARRASDPDVATDFEQELFRWAEQEDVLPLGHARAAHFTPGRSVSATSDRDACSVDSPSVLDDGYGADLDSPMIDRGQHRVGTRIHTQVGARNKFRTRALAVKSLSTMRSNISSATTKVASSARSQSHASSRSSTVDEDGPVVKTPRFSLQMEVVPRIGSPSHEQQQLRLSQNHQEPLTTTIAPAIVLPMESPLEGNLDIEVAGAQQASAALIAQARKSTLNAPKTPFHWSAGLSPSSLLPPPTAHQQVKASLPPAQLAVTSTQEQACIAPLGLAGTIDRAHSPAVPIPIPGPTRLQSRRPNGMRLRNLPDASIWAPAEIEVNGKKLEGRDMKAAAVYDPRKDVDSAFGAAVEAQTAMEEAKALVGDGSASGSLGQVMLKSGELNPPPPTPPRGTVARGAGRVRAATLNAVALKVNMIGGDDAQSGTVQNARIEAEPEEMTTACTGLGIGVGLGLPCDDQGHIKLHGANAPEFDGTSSEVSSVPAKHRSLPQRLPEQVIPRPQVDNWLKDSSKPQPQSEKEASESKRMQAWAIKTFAATCDGKEPGAINAPPSAYVGVAPSPCPGFTFADSMSPHPDICRDDQSDVDVLQQRAVAEAKLNGSPALSCVDAVSAQAEPRASPVPPRKAPAPPLKTLADAILPSSAVSLASASTTASARPFFASNLQGASYTKGGQSINVPRTAILAKDRTRRHNDAAESERSAQLDSVLSAFSTEQLLAHLATRKVASGSKKSERKVSGGSSRPAPAAAAVAAAHVTGDMSPRTRSPLVPQTATVTSFAAAVAGALASPVLFHQPSGSPRPPSRCTPGVTSNPVRTQKRNSAQRALARNRQQRLAGSPLLGDAAALMMARSDSVSSMGSMDMVREDSVSSFGSFVSQSPILPVGVANLHLGSPGLGQQRAPQSPLVGALVDLDTPQATEEGTTSSVTEGGRTVDTEHRSLLMESIPSQMSTDLHVDDRASLLTDDRSSTHADSTELATPATGLSLTAPIGNILTSALARAYLQTRSQTPLDFSRSPLLAADRAARLPFDEADAGVDAAGGPRQAMLMERADSLSSPLLTGA